MSTGRIVEKRNLGRLVETWELEHLEKPCPNKANHCSGFPGHGRIPCPWCGKVYVNASPK